MFCSLTPIRFGQVYPRRFSRLKPSSVPSRSSQALRFRELHISFNYSSIFLISLKIVYQKYRYNKIQISKIDTLTHSGHCIVTFIIEVWIVVLKIVSENIGRKGINPNTISKTSSSFFIIHHHLTR